MRVINKRKYAVLNKVNNELENSNLTLDNLVSHNLKRIYQLVNDIPNKELRNTNQDRNPKAITLKPLVWVEVKKHKNNIKPFITDMITLCDSGADDTLIKRRCLPPDVSLI